MTARSHTRKRRRERLRRKRRLAGQVDRPVQRQTYPEPLGYREWLADRQEATGGR